MLLSIALVAVAAIAFIVWIERGQRRITVNYAKRQQGRKMVQGQASYLPMKINQAGVIPAILQAVCYYSRHQLQLGLVKVKVLSGCKKLRWL